MKSLKLVFCTTAMLAFAGLGNAAILVDQDQPSGPTYMAAFSQTDLAQSFQQDNDNIAGAGILLQPDIGTTDLVTIALWDALPNVAGASQLASGSGSGTAGTWFDVFWSPVPITPNVTFYLVFSGNTTLGIAGDTSDPYAAGQVYANSGFGSFPSFDYAFRTYYEDDMGNGGNGVPGDVAAVPEPTVIGLLALGLLGIAFAGRRQRAWSRITS